MALSCGQYATIFVSGTASITASETRHVGDAAAQTDETLDNIAALISEENLCRHGLPGLGTALDGLGLVRVYIKRQEDYAPDPRGVRAAAGRTADDLRHRPTSAGPNCWWRSRGSRFRASWRSAADLPRVSRSHRIHAMQRPYAGMQRGAAPRSSQWRTQTLQTAHGKTTLERACDDIETRLRNRVRPYVAASLVLGPLDQGQGADAPAPKAGGQGQPVVFQRDVMPLLARLGCATSQCHGAFAGQGGMALSLFGGSPVDDYETIVKAERARRVNRWEPAQSLLLLKATATIQHGGGKKSRPRLRRVPDAAGLDRAGRPL